MTSIVDPSPCFSTDSAICEISSVSPPSKDYILDVLSENGLELEQFEDLQDDREAVRIAIQQNPRAIRCASKTRALEILKENGLMLKHASLEQQRDFDLAEAAIGQNCQAHRFAAPILQRRLHSGSPYNKIPFKPTVPKRLWQFISSPRTLVMGAAIGISTAVGCSTLLGVGVSGLAALGLKLFKNIVSGGAFLRSGAFVGFESLFTDVQGGLPTWTIPPILECVQRLDTPNAKVAKQCLENILLYESEFDYHGLANGSLVAYQQRLLSNLQPGQIMALPCSSFSLRNPNGHIAFASIICQSNGKFTLHVHNAGCGAENHHANKYVTQTAYEINEIEQNKMLEFIEKLADLHAIWSDHSMNTLYATLLPKLGGIKSRSRPDPRVWLTTQTSESCAGYSVKCLLKALLSENEYLQFEEIFLDYIGEKLSQGMTSPWRFWEKTSKHQRLLEAIKLKCKKDDFIQNLQIKPSFLGRLAQKIEESFWHQIFGLIRPQEKVKLWNVPAKSTDSIEKKIDSKMQY